MAKRYDFRLLGILLCAFIAIVNVRLFLPEISATLWHLTHGNSTTWDDWRIPVPEGWFATKDQSSVTILRIPRFKNGRDEAQISVSELASPSGDFQSEGWTGKYVSSMSLQGYRFLRESTVEVDGMEAYCFQFVVVKEDEMLQSACFLPSAKLEILYHGDHAHTMEAESVLKSMRQLSNK